MTKARKAPAKKPVKSSSSRGLKIASLLFVILGFLVAISMVLSSVFTQNFGAASAPPTYAIPTITRAP